MTDRQNNSSFDVVIVGAGHAGAQAAIALREQKFAGSIGLIGAEPDFPYERPPLSKEYLAGEKPFERILIRKPEYWAEREIALMLGETVTGIDPAARKITLQSGGEVEYRHCVWATGGDARMIACPGSDLAGVHTVRNHGDVLQLKDELPAVDQVAVIGGGYIGLEAAAVMRKLGKHVVLLEALDRVLARVAGEELSRFYEAEHRKQGVDLKLGVQIDCIEGTEGNASGVRLANGDLVSAQMVIVGIGIAPAVDLLASVGAQVSNGVQVDAQCRTSLPDVFAIGDCAAHANRFAGGAEIRLESVQNARDMAVTVAKTITGQDAAYDATPWFWSNQYDLKLQTVGLSLGNDETVLRGDPAERSFSVIYLKQGRVIALDCVNVARDYVQGKALVEAGTAIAPGDLSDTSRKLKELLPA